MLKSKVANSDFHKDAGLQSTHVGHNISATDISHENPRLPFSSRFVHFFVIYVTVPCEHIRDPDTPNNIPHKPFYVSIDFIQDFCPINFDEYIFHRKSLTLPKTIRENPEEFKISFSADCTRWCCMREEQYRQSSIVTSATILKITPVGKVNWNTITWTTPIANSYLALVTCANLLTSRLVIDI